MCRPRAPLRTDNLVGEPRHLGVAWVLRHVDQPLVPARVVQAGRKQPLHTEVAHIVQGHRWAGCVLRIGHDVLLSTKEKAQPAGAGLVRRKGPRAHRFTQGPRLGYAPSPVGGVIWVTPDTNPPRKRAQP
jgi:hypothetical protein